MIGPLEPGLVQQAKERTRAGCALLQEDGTLGSLLGDAAPLEALLDALCGVAGAREPDSEVRAALAESVELLVRAAS